MSLIDYARKELQLVGLFDNDSDYNGDIGEAVMKLIETVSKQGHSGESVSITLSAFDRVVRFKPLSPLTGNDDEWMEVGEKMWQNLRCSTVFTDKTTSWDIENPGHRTPIAFPYKP